ncbi:lysophospholipid acyltransferase family protein [Rhodalgimonas zhirmunskyi]|uniref:1-acyl-sn-glycerol-3-phosphate acyltransferase n=1 Tax=Rhodalgimonas zhirmunskyi TaxID=2964767 RepID=A0AAJ1X375_9RHOB|nr:lysophospholipid acyltransferase family protein [Rhodoalgimonas zhirmunskyi]MDQ2093038.1 1-acyl-sn-glycerol-3-phosphate acyltransferase [Rhodoalgimonas zhirmunskyi]
MLWKGEAEPVFPPLSAGDWLRVAWRGPLLVVVFLGGFAVLMLLRLIERPLFGLHRPWTPWIVQFATRSAFSILRIKHRVIGERMRERGAIVANHGSWLDIFALNARKRVYFVSKAEVAKWPVIGMLARGVGTVFINRNPREAKAQQEIFEARLLAGHKLTFFPEGTSSDGRRVLPFKSTLFQAFFTDDLRPYMYIQPVTLIYRAPEGEDPRFYGWWGDMEFGPHFLRVLAARRQGSVTLRYHPPLRVAEFAGRKELAARAEEIVRSGFPEDILALTAG